MVTAATQRLLDHARVVGIPRCSRAGDTGREGNKKAPDDAGAFDGGTLASDQYFATSGPPQLKR
jgi:hypothetical protein